jgi:hypothetical protein
LGGKEGNYPFDFWKCPDDALDGIGIIYYDYQVNVGRSKLYAQHKKEFDSAVAAIRKAVEGVKP